LKVVLMAYDYLQYFNLIRRDKLHRDPYLQLLVIRVTIQFI